MVINLSKNLTLMPNIRTIEESLFLTLNVKKVFNHLRLVFIKVLIFWHFNLESDIRIKTTISGYIINEVLSQLKLDFNILSNNLNKSDFSQWHLVTYFSKKMIFVKIWYNTQNANLLAIIKAFKT